MTKHQKSTVRETRKYVHIYQFRNHILLILTGTCQTGCMNSCPRSYSTEPLNLTFTNITMTSHSPRCNSRTLQAKALIVSPVDIFHQFVHVCRVALASHFQRLLECLTARQKTAEAQKRTASQTESKAAKEDENNTDDNRKMSEEMMLISSEMGVIRRRSEHRSHVARRKQKKIKMNK